jgi:hypothetical protein
MQTTDAEKLGLALREGLEPKSKLRIILLILNRQILATTGPSLFPNVVMDHVPLVTGADPAIGTAHGT